MKYGFDDLYEGPRFQNRARRRKIRLIVAAIAAIIGIFIIIGIVNIFSGGNEEANGTPEKTNDAEQAIDSNDDTADDFETNEDSLSSDNQESMTDDSTSNGSSSDDNHSEHSAINDDDTVSHAASPSESQVIGTIQDDWEAVGTEQAGDHVTDFTKGSQDWNEMTTAVSSATGLSADNMIVWWMGNGGASNKAVSTVSSKDKQTYYRVQLEWVNNAGWKPVLVEQIDGNDHQTQTTATGDTDNETNN